MYLHEPQQYKCPLCEIIAGSDDDQTTVWRDELSIAIVSRSHHPKNAGSILLCSVEHHENLYVLPPRIGVHLFSISQMLAIALKRSLECDGVSTRQHNEPAGTQEVWHYHQHIVPRFHGDNFYSERPVPMTLDRRIEFASLIKSGITLNAR
jgi:histidine triad (HIT) family protein